MGEVAEKVEFHAVANLFPLMTGAAFDDLVSDIKAHGLEVPIELHEGKIIDGRNRFNACAAAGVDPRYKNWDGFGDLISHVVSLNLKRRHLDESQRAMVAARITHLEKGRPPNNASKDAFITQDEAAAMMNVSKPSTQRARVVQRKGVPELVAAVDEGRVSVTAAEEIASVVPHEEQREIVAQGEQAIAAKVKEIRASRSPSVARPPKPKPSDGEIIPQTRKLTGLRKAPEAIRGAIGTLVGLTSGFDHFTVKDAAPSAEEAAEWERDLCAVIAALNKFRRQLKEYEHV